MLSAFLVLLSRARNRRNPQNKCAQNPWQEVLLDSLRPSQTRNSGHKKVWSRRALKCPRILYLLFALSIRDVSTSTAAALPNISTHKTNRKRFLFRTRIPSSPVSGPHLTLTRSPIFRKG